MEQGEKLIANLLQELKRGTLVLSVLLNADEEFYGYNLVLRLQEAGIDIEQNTLYPLLRRLETQGLLKSTWNTDESRPRKYYSITEAGKEIAQKLMREWKRLNECLNSMMEDEE